MKFGRRRPVAPGPRLKLSNYLRAPLPPAPPTVDYSPKGQPALANVYLNDQLGDCVIAGAYHVVATETGNADDLFTATNDQLIKDYSAIGGYDPADPNSDQGCDEPTALNYWLQNGFANGTRPLGWISVDATNADELRSALYLFENLYFGVELPDAWVNPMPNGKFTWDVAGPPVPDNGHCVIGVGYTGAGVTIDTWGLLGTVTWEALSTYFTAVGEWSGLRPPHPGSVGQGTGACAERARLGFARRRLRRHRGTGVAAGHAHLQPPEQRRDPAGAELPARGQPRRLVADGRMGPKTKAAVKVFQQAHNLAVDGIVGPLTRAALRAALAAT